MDQWRSLDDTSATRAYPYEARLHERSGMVVRLGKLCHLLKRIRLRQCGINLADFRRQCASDYGVDRAKGAYSKSQNVAGANKDRS